MRRELEQMKKLIRELEILDNRSVARDQFQLTLRGEEVLPEVMPGQFVNVAVPDSPQTFLRRPFSVLDFAPETNTLSLLIKAVGQGTRHLAACRVGQKLSLLLPLGRKFTLPESADRIFLIGGGSGIAPMLFLAKYCGLPREQVTLFLGARSRADAIALRGYEQYARCYIATEDGSVGERGFVTLHSIYKSEFTKNNRIYACGPAPMLKAIAKDAVTTGIFYELSLENMMACGFGVCLCCVEPTIYGNRTVCSHGPVFNINELTWQI